MEGEALEKKGHIAFAMAAKLSSSSERQKRSKSYQQAIEEVTRRMGVGMAKFICKESELQNQELLAQLAAEEQREHELTRIVRELMPTSKKTANPERQPRHRRRSNDRTRMSKRLTKEAEQYFEDFLSNVEDTDFSSFDGDLIRLD